VALGYGEDALMNGLVGGFDDYGMKIGVAQGQRGRFFNFSWIVFRTRSFLQEVLGKGV
jgi:hypothetical protein